MMKQLNKLKNYAGYKLIRVFGFRHFAKSKHDNQKYVNVIIISDN